LLQDAGAAIKGPTRADLFWGNDAEAEAGLMAQRGELYLLMKKSSGEQRVMSNE
jgi:peptidoglycan lytic transglycosylase A